METAPSKDFCPVNTEAVKPEGEKEVKSSTMILLFIVILLLIVSVSLAYLIFVNKEAVPVGQETPSVTPASTVTQTQPTADPESLESLESDIQAVEIDDFSSTLEEVETELENL